MEYNISIQPTLSAENSIWVRNNAFSHYQSRFYPLLLRAYGKEPVWLVVKNVEGEQVIATWLLFLTPENPLNPLKNSILQKMDVHLQAMHGPTIKFGYSDDEISEIMGILLKAVDGIIKTHKVLTTNLYLDPLMSEARKLLWQKQAERYGFVTSAKYTYVAVLPKTIDEMHQQIKGDRRTKIRKAEKSGITFHIGKNLSDLEKYYQVRCETTDRNESGDVPWIHFEDSWKALEGTECLKVFLAEKDGRIGAGQMAYVHNGYVHLTGVSAASWTYQEKIPANDFLQWHVMKWAIEKGYKVVDFVGAQPNSADPKIKAIDHFKSRWGTSLHESIKLEYPRSKIRYIIFKVLRKLLKG